MDFEIIKVTTITTKNGKNCRKLLVSDPSGNLFVLWDYKDRPLAAGDYVSVKLYPGKDLTPRVSVL